MKRKRKAELLSFALTEGEVVRLFSQRMDPFSSRPDIPRQGNETKLLKLLLGLALLLRYRG